MSERNPSVLRGGIYLSLGASVVLGAIALGANALWRAGDQAAFETARREAILARGDAASDDLKQWRAYGQTLKRGYFLAPSAAQAEAQLREALTGLISARGGELASIQTKPAERGDADGVLRLRVSLNAQQEALPDLLRGFSDARPIMVIDAVDLQRAGGMRRPGAKTREQDPSLQMALDIIAVWREEGIDG